MTNKITQLVNESGDNLYPLAGGMAADSINTQMLKDGAVTSDKIDWTTMVTDVSDEITFNTNIVENVGAARRYGKLVYLTITSSARTWSSGDLIATFSGNLAPVSSWPVGVSSTGQSCELNVAQSTRQLTYSSGFGTATARLRCSIIVALL